MSKQAKKLRRIISVFLAAVMAVSCFSVSAAAACEKSGAVGKAVSGDSVGAPAPEHPGIHFTDNQDWGFVYFYAWDENGDPLCGDWPGTAMEYEYHNDFGEAVYVAQIPADLAGFVFNSGFDGEQTENVTVDCYFKECYYYPSGEIDEYGTILFAYMT